MRFSNFASCILNYPITSVLLQLIIMLLFFGIILTIAKLAGMLQFIREQVNRKELALCLLFYSCSILFVYFLIKQESTIYYWDYAGYWNKTLLLIQEFEKSSAGAMKLVIQSINYDEYNYLLCAVISLPLSALGGGRTAYILLVYTFFTIPSCIFLSYLSKMILHKLNNRSFSICICTAIVLLSFWIYFPVLLGYADSIGLLFCISFLLLVFNTNLYLFSIRRNLLAVFCLGLIVLCRRYYAYSVVGLVIGIIIFTLFDCHENHKHRNLIPFFLNLVFIGLSCFLLLALFFPEFVKRSLFSNYTVAYSAYNTTDLAGKFLQMNQYLGYFVVILLIIGSSVGIWKQNSRKYILFCLSSFLMSVLLFYQVQNMTWHHYYIIMPQLLILITICFHNICTLIPQSFRKYGLAVMICFYAINFMNSFYYVPALHSGRIPFFSAVRYSPQIRPDLNTIHELCSYLEEADPDKKGIYIVGSSAVFNDDIVKKAYLPQIQIPLNILPTSAIDLRDGFATTFFDAEIIVVATPAQYHKKEEDQQVTGILTEEFQNSYSVISQLYQTDKSFTLQKDVTVTVYRKIYPYSKETIDYVMNRFDQVYPDFPELFHDRFIKYMETIE